ncbi:MAG: hypothetical protein DMG59_27650 [Acidobacteria bacterium]|jgi:hypothetical protein|nr:MAG: hypothetical protein DMG59_27650 [Acidobacteriota bacterium]
MRNENEKFWANLALNLTIAARETYVPQTEEVAEPGKLRAYNEMLHRICSHLATPNGGSASWLLPMLVEIAERTAILSSVNWAIADARKKTGSL